MAFIHEWTNKSRTGYSVTLPQVKMPHAAAHSNAPYDSKLAPQSPNANVPVDGKAMNQSTPSKRFAASGSKGLTSGNIGTVKSGVSEPILRIGHAPLQPKSELGHNEGDIELQSRGVNRCNDSPLVQRRGNNVFFQMESSTLLIFIMGTLFSITLIYVARHIKFRTDGILPIVQTELAQRKSNLNRTLAWFPTAEGVTQHLLILKSAAYLAMVTNRTLLIPPLYSYLYNDLSGQHITDWIKVEPFNSFNHIRIWQTTWKKYPQPLTSCDQMILNKFKDSKGNYRGFFAGNSQESPSSFRANMINESRSSENLLADSIASDAGTLCIVGHYSAISEKLSEAHILLHAPVLSLLAQRFALEHALGSYIAVHWRTGDICAREASKGIGTCADPSPWIDKLIGLYPNRSFYVATDEDDPIRLSMLQELGRVQTSRNICLGKLDVEKLLCDYEMMFNAEIFIRLDIPVGNAGRWRSSLDRYVENYRRSRGKLSNTIDIG